MPARRVWITRTEPGASRLEARLADAGYPVVKQPLLQVESLVGPALGRRIAALPECGVFIALSTHAVRLGLPLLKRHLPGHAQVPWIAVGKATAAALLDEGLEVRRPAVESSEGILASAVLPDMRGLRVGLLCGQGGRELLGEELGRRGAEVHRLEVYQRVPVTLEPAWLASQLAGIAVVVISSTEAGVALNRWVGAAERRRMTALAASERIAATLRDAGFEHVAVAEGADDDATLAGVQDVLDERCGGAVGVVDE